MYTEGNTYTYLRVREKIREDTFTRDTDIHTYTEQNTC